MDSFTLAGLIFMIVLGPAVGNYACSVVYRLPRGQTPFEKKPYCGHCGAMLQPRDLFPIVSFLMTRGKCRFCGDPIRLSYFVIELLCLVLFVANFLLLGMSENFLLLTAFAVFLIILVFIDYHDHFLSSFMLTLALLTAGLNRTLMDGTIYPWFQGGFVCLFGAAMLWQAGRKGKGVLSEVPHWVWLSGLIGVALPSALWLLALGLAGLLYLLQRICNCWKSTSAAFCLSIYAVMLLYQAEALSFILP